MLEQVPHKLPSSLGVSRHVQRVDKVYKHKLSLLRKSIGLIRQLLVVYSTKHTTPELRTDLWQQPSSEANISTKHTAHEPNWIRPDNQLPWSRILCSVALNLVESNLKNMEAHFCQLKNNNKKKKRSKMTYDRKKKSYCMCRHNYEPKILNDEKNLFLKAHN